LLQAIAVVVVIAIVLGNLAADLLYTAANPRIRCQQWPKFSLLQHLLESEETKEMDGDRE